MQIRLSEGTPETGRGETVAAAHGRVLTDAEVQAVLDRLPPLKKDAADEVPFALREKSLPPPRTGQTIAATFPPAESAERPDEPASGPLRVLRHSPDGSVPLAPSLSVTFSQPMVAVTSHDELARQEAPVKLTPEPPGKWRWVGTRTLLFEPAPRFPMATDYRVEVPAGTRAATGGTLAAASQWTFSTARPTLVAKHPADEPARRETLIFAAFDQKVDPAAVLATVKVSAGGSAARLRLATPEEVEADEAVKRFSEASEPGRWLAFRAVDPLPSDTPVTVTVGPGTPSAEGPRRTDKAQSWDFRTFGPLRVVGHRCGWGGPCVPGLPWQIELSNPIDPKRFRKDLVHIDPAVSSFRVDVSDRWLNVRPTSKGRTSYRVTLAAALADVFGQTLEQDAAVTFEVGPADAALWSSGKEMVVLDPAGRRQLSVYSTNHSRLKVQLLAVRPEDWSAYLTFLEKAQRREAGATPPGRSVRAETIAVAGQPDELTETAIDLGPALEEGLGQVVVIVEPTVPPKEPWQRQAVRVWVQSTHLGLAAFADDSQIQAWASSLDDGRPLPDVDLQLLPGGSRARTDASGVTVLPLGSTAADLLVARRGQDVALLPENTYWWYRQSSWKRETALESLRWYTFDDRHLYRPGEEVRVKGWIRRFGPGKGGDVAALDGVASEVHYQLMDSRGNEVLKGTRPVGAFGSFDLTLKLPPTMNLGPANVTLSAGGPGRPGGTQTHTFDVQEFRRPEFEVTTAVGEGPHFVGAGTTVTASASYYAGGGLPNADLSWRVSSSPGTFTPPNRDDFIFGIWVPWWEIHSLGVPGPPPLPPQTLAAKTDAAGRHSLRLDFQSVDPARATSVHVEATVTDVNRQAWTSSSDLLVHAADVYVGLRSERLFVQKGEPLRLQAIATDLDGAAVAGRPIEVKAERLEWESVDGEWKETPADPQDCRLTSAAEAGRCTFATREGGTYRITATVTDAKERRNQTEIRLWVAGGTLPPRRDVEQEKVTLIPSKKEYRAGETAEILVLAPFGPAEGVLTLRRSGIFKTERFTMTGSSHTLRIPLEAGWTPNVWVQVDLVGASTRTDAADTKTKLPARPAFAQGSIQLEIPPHERTLTLAVAPAVKALEPGGSTRIDVDVKDAGGQPAARTEVALIVVDEAVLSLAGYKVPDPLSVFYAQREGGGRDYHLRQHVVLARPAELEAPVPQAEDKLQTLGDVAEGFETATRVGGVVGGVVGGMPAPSAAPPARMKAFANGARGGAPEPEPIRLRTDLAALALFVPGATTDANGHVQVDVKLPDSLTRYRITAVAATSGNHFGKGESTITARLPLMVRPSAPRFLNFGDQIELPVVLQNQTDAPLEVDVALRASNATLTAPAGRRVTVPASNRVEVRFPVSAALAGTARFQVGAVSGRSADAAEIRLPVWTPATTEAFATYGQIDQGAIVQPVKAPAGVVPQFGGLEVTTSSTAVQALTDAVLYLVSYPFECSEQISSRVLGIAALKDVLTAFHAEGLPSKDEMVGAVDRDIERLRRMQNDDGGFSFWRRGDESWPYLSIHVAHALTRAKEKGFNVPGDVLDRSKGYLKNVERHIPDYYGPDSRRTLIAYTLYVRQRLGDRDAARARSLIQEAGLEKLPFETLGWLLPVLQGDAASATEVAAILHHLGNRATETAATAHFAVSYGDGDHLILSSDRRADAVILEALIGADPKNDLIPKLVEGLLGHRTRGRWTNTQENTFVLLALDRYFGTYEKVTPDFVARAWLGEAYAGEHKFHGRTTERHEIDVPMRYVAEGAETKNLLIAKDGPGRLYYRIGLQYAPASLTLAPADHGFTVERTYEAIDDKGDVTRDADGTWRIQAGARVHVRLTMVAPSRRYHVALVDPLPAGLEALNPALKTTGTLPNKTDETVDVIGAPGLGRRGVLGSWWWWRRSWYDHENLRDERVEAFAALLFEGVYTYRYVARATTPGAFVVPPTKAEEMYHPETFGRASTDRVIVEARAR
jgi:uncharacterized protein YfaS (alpha-2-macroglobulin family)